MIQRITSREGVKKIFSLAEQFTTASESALYDPETMLTTWDYLLKNKLGVLITYTKKGKAVGVIGGIKHPDMTSGIMTATESFWFVDPEHRGIGLFLLKAFEDWAKEEGCKRILMMALLDSLPEKAIRIYQQAGYKPLEVTYIKEV